MNDLFNREQGIYDGAMKIVREMNEGSPLNPIEFEALANEYGRLLRQLRRITKISDRTTIDLNASKLDLLDKVNYDALTGIYNRRFMEENLKRIIKSLSRSQPPCGGVLSVLMMDVDYFKRYNDTYGHSMGDECLKSIAEVLSKNIKRPDDFLARYGGEEFIVVLPNTGEKGARIMAERMIENVSSLGILHENNDAADCVTISIGVTTGNVSFTHNGGDYVKLADKALYMSKQNGRNQYTFIRLEEGV